MEDPKKETKICVESLHWRPSNLMEIPNADCLERTGSEMMGARLWKLPPMSANTHHRHITSEEFFFVLEGIGKIRVDGNTHTLRKHEGIHVWPHQMRQVFNHTDKEVLWLITGSPDNEIPKGQKPDLSKFYPTDPTELPPELHGTVWPPSQNDNSSPNKQRQGMNDDERVKPFGMWRYGCEFLECVTVIKDPAKPEHPLDHHAPTPALYLASHAIELFLKSYLRAKGKRLKELRTIGHDLCRALGEAEREGLGEFIEVGDDRKAELALLNQTYASKDFEYFKQGYFELPYYERVCEFARNLKDALRPSVESTVKPLTNHPPRASRPTRSDG